LADEHKLTRFATLTLDPKRIPDPEKSDRYIRECWRKMRVKLERKYGSPLKFISVLEFHYSGVAHLHVLLDRYIPQEWLSEAWQAIGGGEIVDIRFVDVRRVASYLAKYLTGDKIERTLRLLHKRARIFTTSRGLRLSDKKEPSGWWPSVYPLEELHDRCPNPSAERYAPDPIDEGQGPPILVYFAGSLTTLAAQGKEAFTVLRRLVAAKGQADFVLNRFSQSGPSEVQR